MTLGITYLERKTYMYKSINNEVKFLVAMFDKCVFLLSDLSADKIFPIIQKVIDKKLIDFTLIYINYI